MANASAETRAQARTGRTLIAGAARRGGSVAGGCTGENWDGMQPLRFTQVRVGMLPKAAPRGQRIPARSDELFALTLRSGLRGGGQ